MISEFDTVIHAEHAHQWLEESSLSQKYYLRSYGIALQLHDSAQANSAHPRPT